VTTPADPAPQPTPAPATTPPAPAAPAAPATPPAQQQPATPEDVARLRATLDGERQARKDAEQKLAAAQAASMSDQEKAIAAARAEGKAEAEQAAAQRLAAAEFRIAAAGRIANPEAALGVIDLSKLVQKNGEPNRQAISALVEQLAVVPNGAQPGGNHVIPTGPRQSAPAADGDWLRQVARPQGRRG
jgi:hypothetical protein